MARNSKKKTKTQLIAVFIHFNHFIDLKINFHTNSYDLAPVRLL